MRLSTWFRDLAFFWHLCVDELSKGAPRSFWTNERPSFGLFVKLSFLYKNDRVACVGKVHAVNLVI